MKLYENQWKCEYAILRSSMLFHVIFCVPILIDVLFYVILCYVMRLDRLGDGPRSPRPPFPPVPFRPVPAPANQCLRMTVNEIKWDSMKTYETDQR